MYVGSGFQGAFLGAFRLNGKGDIQGTDKVAWVIDRDVTDISSPLLSSGRLYFHKGKTGILTCMDARLDPAKYAGLAEGDAHVIRNAGGRASDDAIRSLVISHKLLGTNEWFVIHHTDCGMETFTNEIMADLLASSLDTATVDETGWHDTGSGPGSEEGRYINWLLSPQSDSYRVSSLPTAPFEYKTIERIAKSQGRGFWGFFADSIN